MLEVAETTETVQNGNEAIASTASEAYVSWLHHG